MNGIKGTTGIVVSILAVVAGSLAPASAGAAVLSTDQATVYYIADQGERNDVVVRVRMLLGQPVYTFTDNDASPISIGDGVCDLINGVGMCSQSGIATIHVNVRDRDDTIEIATAGSGGLAPPLIPTTLIGGRGHDVLTGGHGPDLIKGNNGRDALRGRKGADFYKGGRGADTLQTLDGIADAGIFCGEGIRDLVRADKVDPKPRRCELGGRRPSKRF